MMTNVWHVRDDDMVYERDIEDFLKDTDTDRPTNAEELEKVIERMKAIGLR